MIINSRYPLTNANFDGLSDDISDVEKLIFDEKMNPFLAWLKILEIEPAALPSLLKIDESRSRRYMSDTGKIPPPKDVALFCDRLGIHPAYLQPTLREESYLYYTSPSILSVIADVLDDPFSSPDDRALSMEALKKESAKFRAFEKDYEQHAALMRSAYSRSKIVGDEPGCLAGCAGQFEAAVHQSPVQDMDVVLEHYRRYLVGERKRIGGEKVSREIRSAYLHYDLIKSAEKMSADFSKDRLDSLLSVAEEISKVANGSAMLKDFMRAMGGAGFRIRSTADLGAGQKFIEVLPRYVEEKQQARTFGRAHETITLNIEKFDSLMRHKDMDILAIPLYQNYLFAKANIEKFESRQRIPQGSVVDVHWP